MSSYEQLRLKNIADNKRILAEIGLVNPFRDLPRVSLKKGGLKRKADTELPNKRKRPLLEENVDHFRRGSIIGTRRKSARIEGNAIPTKDELENEVEDWKSENEKPSKVEKNRPNFYGAVPDVDVGTSWLTRVECCRDGIHRPTVAGIHGGQEGAYSIALSGGYDDNIDLGECFTYTGEGGRDLKGTSNNPKNLRTAPQSKDQTLSRGNLALSRSVETGNPVRVIRGYKLAGLSPFAPEEGYRYDGLYSVEKAWYTTGASGFGVWKFALRRCECQASPPWHLAETGTEEGDMNKENNNDENQSDRNEQNNNSPEKNNIDEGSEAKETDNKSDDPVPEENSPEPTDELENDITEDNTAGEGSEVSVNDETL